MQVLRYLCLAGKKFVYALIREMCLIASVPTKQYTLISEYVLISNKCLIMRKYGIISTS